VCIRKERFHKQMRFTLMQKEYDLFEIIEKINDNDYKVDLSGEYEVNATFNEILQYTWPKVNYKKATT